MSERGSFVTEYIYCSDCFEAVSKILEGNEKYFKAQQIDGWEGMKDKLPIIAGKVGGLYCNEEIHYFEFEIVPELEKVICCPLRIAVLADAGEQKIFKIKPKK